VFLCVPRGKCISTTKPKSLPPPLRTFYDQAEKTLRRKNRKWMATAVVLYLIVMVLAYRWGVSQRPTTGPLLEHLENEAVRKSQEKRAEEARQQIVPPTGEARLNAAGPAFVAARYDATHVVFMLATETESRFSSSALTGAAIPTKVSAPPKSAAPLAGLQELWEPDSQSLHFFPRIIQTTQPGDEWIMNVGPDSTIPVEIERPVIAPMGCSLALGFLASVPPERRSAFAATRREYFSVRRSAVESANPPVNLPVGEISDWKPSPAITKQIEDQLNARMKQELAKIDNRLLANAGSPGATAGETMIGSARPHLKEWLHADRGLLRDEGKLDYDIRAFHLAPDNLPRLFVRARWKLADSPVFLMSAWFKTDWLSIDSQNTGSIADSQRAGALQPNPASQSGSQVLLLALTVDSTWSTAMRGGDGPATLGDTLDFQTVLNEFDADHDGWAEILIHSQDAASTKIGLYLYTDVGLVPLKTPLTRDAHDPETCLAQ
jgi:hypothetical protein